MRARLTPFFPGSMVNCGRRVVKRVMLLALGGHCLFNMSMNAVRESALVLLGNTRHDVVRKCPSIRSRILKFHMHRLISVSMLSKAYLQMCGMVLILG